jgi:hypothetical protein
MKMARENDRCQRLRNQRPEMPREDPQCFLRVRKTACADPAVKSRMLSEAALPGVVVERAAEKGAKADWEKRNLRKRNLD